MLTIRGLSKSYPNGIKALRDVSLNIPTGVFGLLGPNGAGKTTLMRTLATLQEADEGTADFSGVNILEDKVEARKLLGYLPQEFGVYPRATAQAMLDHLALLKGITDSVERKTVVSHLLSRTSLHDVRHQRLGTFSGGMKRRFGIAQALLGEPRLLIVDEPTAGLDPEQRRRFLDLFSEIGENMVVILSTHIVEDVNDLCSQMAVLVGGRIVLAGDPSRLVSALDGQIWSRTTSQRELAGVRARFRVLSSRLRAGLTEIRVLSSEEPGEGFEHARPDLTDVYFATLRSAQSVPSPPC